MGNTPSKNFPALKNAGYAFSFLLYNAVTAIAAITTGLASFIVPSTGFANNKYGHPLRVAFVQFSIENLGSGASSGNFVLKLIRVSDGATVGSATFAYNAATKTQQIDVRNPDGTGIYVPAGDTLRLDVTTIPASVTGAQGFKALVIAKQYGLDA